MLDDAHRANENLENRYAEKVTESSVIPGLNDKVKYLENEKQKGNRRANELGELVEELEKRSLVIPGLEVEKNALHDEKNRNRAVIDDLNGRLEDYMKKNNCIEMENNQIPLLISKLEDKTKAHKELERRLNDTLVDRDDFASDARRENEKNQQRIYDLERTVYSKENQLESLNVRATRLESEIDNLCDENDYNAREHNVYKSKLSVAENNLKIIPSLDAQIKVVTEEKNKAKDQLNEAYFNIGQLKSEKQDLEARMYIIPSLEDQLASVKGEKEVSLENLHNLTMDNRDLRSRVALLEKDLLQIDVLQKRIEVLSQNLDDANRRIEEDDYARDNLVKTIKQREEEVRNSAIGFGNRENELAAMIRDLTGHKDM